MQTKTFTAECTLPPHPETWVILTWQNGTSKIVDFSALDRNSTRLSSLLQAVTAEEQASRQLDMMEAYPEIEYISITKNKGRVTVTIETT